MMYFLGEVCVCRGCWGILKYFVCIGGMVGRVSVLSLYLRISKIYLGVCIGGIVMISLVLGFEVFGS